MIQKGFLSGRFIGENTRMMYDIISHADKLDIPKRILAGMSCCSWVISGEMQKKKLIQLCMHSFLSEGC